MNETGWYMAQFARQAGISRQRLYDLSSKGRGPIVIFETTKHSLGGRPIVPYGAGVEWLKDWKRTAKERARFKPKKKARTGRAIKDLTKAQPMPWWRTKDCSNHINRTKRVKGSIYDYTPGN